MNNSHLMETTAAGTRCSRCLRTPADLAGLEAARARGRKGGRPSALAKMEPRNLASAKDLYAAKQNTVQEIMALTGFKSRATFYKYVVNISTEEKQAQA